MPRNERGGSSTFVRVLSAPGSPFSTETDQTAVLSNVEGTAIFVSADPGAGSIRTYSVGTDGNLALADAFSTSSNSGLLYLPQKQLLLSGSPSLNVLDRIKYFPETLNLEAAGSSFPIPVLSNCFMEGFHTEDRVFLSGGGSDTISSYLIDSTGSLSDGGTFNIPVGDSTALSAHPSKSVVYAASNDNKIFRLEIVAQNILSAQTFSTAEPLGSLALDPSGRFMFGKSGNTNTDLFLFGLAAGDGAISDSSSFATVDGGLGQILVY